MPTYISLANITDQGMRNIKEIPERARRSQELAERLGCKLTAYPTMGIYDVVFVLEAPDDETAARYFLTVGSAGNIRTTTLKALSTDEFMRIAGSIG
jgi:uncharacterized protein with GYD domain